MGPAKQICEGPFRKSHSEEVALGASDRPRGPCAVHKLVLQLVVLHARHTLPLLGTQTCCWQGSSLQWHLHKVVLVAVDVYDRLLECDGLAPQCHHEVVVPIGVVACRLKQQQQDNLLVRLHGTQPARTAMTEIV